MNLYYTYLHLHYVPLLARKMNTFVSAHTVGSIYIPNDPRIRRSLYVGGRMGFSGASESMVERCVCAPRQSYGLVHTCMYE